MLDAFNRNSYAVALAPGAKITAATTNGTAVDLSSVNNGANSLVFSVVCGTITDGTWTFKLQDSPDNTTWTDVPAPYVQTQNASWTSATPSGTVTKLGYLGNVNGANRYVRLVVMGATVTTGGYITSIAELGLSSLLPAA
jgi:hypothetical protein